MSVRLIERTPKVIVRTREDWQHRLAHAAARLLWGLRVELVLLAAGWTAGRLLAVVLPRPLPGVILLTAAGLLVVWPPSRRWLAARLYAARVGRAWDRGCRHARLATVNDRVPRVVSLRRVPAGELLRVKVPAGSSVLELEAHAETVAAYLAVREVRVRRDEGNARYADVTLVRVDPLAGTVALAWPYLDAQRLSLWEPIPVGVDEDGSPVTISLPERNLLLGGEPGGGKSVAESLILATAALDPDVDVTLLDGKQVELSVWRPIARAFVGPDLAAAIEVLRGLQLEMDRRYAWLLEHARRKDTRGDGLRLHVVAVDELAYFLTATVKQPNGRVDRDAPKEFANLLRDLVSRGRAAGIIVVAATQKPSGDVVPTALRDLFGFR